VLYIRNETNPFRNIQYVHIDFATVKKERKRKKERKKETEAKQFNSLP
jgi:hypothetical protein